jgi:hypothetical protein
MAADGREHNSQRLMLNNKLHNIIHFVVRHAVLERWLLVMMALHNTNSSTLLERSDAWGEARSGAPDFLIITSKTNNFSILVVLNMV